MNLLYSNRSRADMDFIQEVCGHISDQGIEKKEVNSEWGAIYVEGRNRDVNDFESYCALRSFKVYSKYDSPIYCFLHNDKNFFGYTYGLIDKWNIKVIKIPQLNNLDEYTNFCVKELYHLLPKDVKYIVTLQPDAALLKNGWEDIIVKNNWIYVGSPWTHAPAIEIQNKDGNWEDFGRPVRVGNGGFSVRSVDFCRSASNYYSKFNLREKFAPNNKIPPEDLFYSVIANNLTINVPTVEEANQFCCDPLTPEKYKSGKYYGFHYFKS